ncbi:MAG: PA14 domain-containing protein, partial [Candidatus Magnetoovum sp. WYHC-5]|nr:PA14 domain-containing protein [Candidatus Magnetoovum sp. WYHC-5]
MKSFRLRQWIMWLVILATIFTLFVYGETPAYAYSAGDMEYYCSTPPFITQSVPPLLMLVMGRDHKLFYEAYNDASDLDGDGTLDTHYKSSIDYYGYFDNDVCYTYQTDKFVPTSAANASKMCSGASEWSGDFLNYVTMAKIDTIRKVLYGGYRSTDTTSETVLERTGLPQDAHGWGKEYAGATNDGYDIRDYTPLDLPSSNTRHLFANISLSSANNPLLRVLPNNSNRIWWWVSKERPVADESLESSSGLEYDDHPDNHQEFEDLVNLYANSSHLCGSGNVSWIKGTGNPYTTVTNCSNEHYLAIFEGYLKVTSAGNYAFAADGDDAVEVLVDGQLASFWYGGHGTCGDGYSSCSNCSSYSSQSFCSFTSSGSCSGSGGGTTGTNCRNACNYCRSTHVKRSSYTTDWASDGGSNYIYLAAGNHTITFRMEERTGGDSYYLWWKGPDSSNNWQRVLSGSFNGLTMSTYNFYGTGSQITDYTVRVQACNSSFLGDECQSYSSGTYKPIGILQKYGEDDQIYFGLITGSYNKNTSGGVLRKNISSFSDEVNSSTGIFTGATNGIVTTLNKIKITGFDYTNYYYNENCGWITSQALSEGQCRSWGNPIGEMMYEGLRYFSGATTATSAYTYSSTDSSIDDNKLGLPLPGWVSPYDSAASNFPSCSKPFMLVFSDITPSYDTDQLPGTSFATFSDTFQSLNVSTLANTISTNEADVAGLHYIGQSGVTYDGSCFPKTVTGFSDIRGLCPDEPTKNGGYYSAAVAYYGLINDINLTASGNQNVTTYAIAMAPQVPKIEFSAGNQLITLVPFGKTVWNYSDITARGSFQPTNTIVDFYVESLGSSNGKFRVNFEDVEQGADHDMDAIVSYEYQVNSDIYNTFTVKLTTEYAGAGYIMHMGYILSGSTN